MSLIFAALLIVLILFQVVGAAYEGPVKIRPRWSRWLNWGLAVLFLLFAVILGQQILTLWRI